MSAAFDQMTPDEQIAHVQDLWDRIAQRPENVGISEAWRDELRRRIAEYEADPTIGVPLEAVASEVRARFGPKE